MRSNDRRGGRVKDQLRKPENGALVLVDNQPPQVSTSVSMNAGDLVFNVVALAKTAALFDLQRPVLRLASRVSAGRSQRSRHLPPLPRGRRSR